MATVPSQVSEVLAKIQRHHVEETICEFDHIKLKGMLREYEGGESTSWYVHYESCRYDAKLLLRAAGKKASGILLSPSELRSKAARSRLKQLGFEFTSRLNKKLS